jgi:hypothetical protein|tara:strand:+ start:2038 stop:2946 length:909 start_codon:yes stop_codon:yes gene_type:complete
MGLLSFPGLIEGFAESINDRFDEQRKNMPGYLEDVRNAAKNVNQKGADLVKETEANIKAYKAVANNIGAMNVNRLDNYLAQGGTIEEVYNLHDKGNNEQLQELLSGFDNNPVADFDYIQGQSNQYKLESDNLASELDSYINVPKNTSTLFTKGLAEKQTERLRTAADATIKPAEEIDTTFVPREGDFLNLSRDPTYEEFREKQLLASEYLMTIPPEKSEQILRQTYNTIYGVDATVSQNQENVNQTVNNENLDIGVDEFLETEETQSSLPTDIDRQLSEIERLSGVDTTSKASKKALKARGL